MCWFGGSNPSTTLLDPWTDLLPEFESRLRSLVSSHAGTENPSVTSRGSQRAISSNRGRSTLTVEPKRMCVLHSEQMKGLLALLTDEMQASTVQTTANRSGEDPVTGVEAGTEGVR